MGGGFHSKCLGANSKQEKSRKRSSYQPAFKRQTIKSPKPAGVTSPRMSEGNRAGWGLGSRLSVFQLPLPKEIPKVGWALGSLSAGLILFILILKIGFLFHSFFFLRGVVCICKDLCKVLQGWPVKFILLEPKKSTCFWHLFSHPAYLEGVYPLPLPRRGV